MIAAIVLYALAAVVAWLALCVYFAGRLDDPRGDQATTYGIWAFLGALAWPVLVVAVGLMAGTRWVFTRIWWARYGHLIPTQAPDQPPASAQG